MMIKFEKPIPRQLSAALRRLGVRFFGDELSWRGANELATAVRAAIAEAGWSEILAYPSDWRDACNKENT